MLSTTAKALLQQLPSVRKIDGIMCGTQDMGVKDASEQILESQAIAEST